MRRESDALLAGVASTSGCGDRTLTLPGGDVLQYVLLGRCAADDPVIFLLHGVLPTPRYANDCLLGFYFCGLQNPDSFPAKIIVLTRRGYGHSNDAPNPSTWSYHDFATELMAVADKELAHRFIVVGHSSGGPNALACAAHFPDRVAACGLLASDAPYPALAGDTYSDPLSFFSADTLRMACGRCCAEGLYNDFGVERRPYSFAVSHVECPTLLLVGQLDWATGTEPTRALARRIPNSTMRIVPCAEHMMVTYSSAILDPFLRDLIALATTAPRVTARTSARGPSPARMMRRRRSAPKL
jgi:pimeloyl-ACP methyl ester carboxylesterase